MTTHIGKNRGKCPAADLALFETHALCHTPHCLGIQREGWNRGDRVALAKHGSHLGAHA